MNHDTNNQTQSNTLQTITKTTKTAPMHYTKIQPISVFQQPKQQKHNVKPNNQCFPIKQNENTMTKQKNIKNTKF